MSLCVVARMTVTVTSLQGLMNLPGRPVAAFDPEGLIFAAGISSESLKLYDLRSFDKVWNCCMFVIS